jgi:hypothetical protein
MGQSARQADMSIVRSALLTFRTATGLAPSARSGSTEPHHLAGQAQDGMSVQDTYAGGCAQAAGDRLDQGLAWVNRPPFLILPDDDLWAE